MANFKYYIKNQNGNKSSTVYLTISSNGKRIKFFNGLSIEPKFWNTNKQRAEKVNYAPEFNTALEKIISDAKIAANRLKAELQTEPEPEQIKQELEKIYFKDREQVKSNFFSFFEDVAEKCKIRNNLISDKPLSPSRAKSIIQTLNVIKDFQNKTKFKVSFKAIDRDFYDKFKNYMETERGYTANNIGKHFKIIKTVMNEATEKGINTNLKYKSAYFKILTEPVNNIYLNESELNEIQQLDLTNKPKLDKVRDLFLIGAWTGLRFSDFSRLNKNNFKKDSDDNYNIFIKTQKTDTEVEIPVFPEIIPIIKKYGGFENIELPRALSIQKYNVALKEIGKIATSLHTTVNKEITKAGQTTNTLKSKYELLSTHTARRSFATNMFNRQPGDVSLIMTITGHKTEKEFYKYIKMNPENKAKLFRQKFFIPNLKIAQ